MDEEHRFRSILAVHQGLGGAPRCHCRVQSCWNAESLQAPVVDPEGPEHAMLAEARAEVAVRRRMFRGRCGDG